MREARLTVGIKDVDAQLELAENWVDRKECCQGASNVFHLQTAEIWLLRRTFSDNPIRWAGFRVGQGVSEIRSGTWRKVEMIKARPLEIGSTKKKTKLAANMSVHSTIDAVRHRRETKAPRSLEVAPCLLKNRHSG